MRLQRTVSLVLALLVLAACGGGRGVVRGVPGGAAPAVTVERFLRLAADKDYAEMGLLFGTREGSIVQRDPAPEVEKRMYAIATVLENQKFAIRETSQIPGRSDAMQVNVQVEGRAGARQVPFTVVRSGERWFIEVVDLEKLTRIQ